MLHRGFCRNERETWSPLPARVLAVLPYAASDGSEGLEVGDERDENAFPAGIRIRLQLFRSYRETVISII